MLIPFSKLRLKARRFNFNNQSNCCVAPQTTINFDSFGNMRVCCYNNKFILGQYPLVKPLQAWSNPERLKFINNLKQLDLKRGCDGCLRQILSNNSVNAHFSKFNYLEQDVMKYPISLEFEFSNTCNFECIMCGGDYSSSIRKNREHLSVRKPPYDETFIKDVEPFLIKAKHISFLGGEPFLTPLYTKIIKKLLKINPSVNVYVTTNGSISYKNIEDWFKLKNLNVTVSIDSLKKEVFESIRVNSSFEKVMLNTRLLKYRGKLSAIAFCPIIQNVLELPDIINFCIQNEINLIINNVTGSLGGKKNKKLPSFTLKTLSREKLKHIINVLSKYSFSDTTLQSKYTGVVNYIKSL